MLSTRLPLLSAQRLLLYRPFSSSSSVESKKPNQDEVKENKPQYATRQSYERSRNEHRFRTADENSGVVPTKWQRRFLIWTRIYSSSSEIPEYVAQPTMNRMHDRMRVLFIVVGVFIFFTFSFVIEFINARRVKRDREAGVVVTKIPLSIYSLITPLALFQYSTQSLLIPFQFILKMGIFRKVFMSAAHVTQEHDKFQGIPAIPKDIGYKSGKDTSGSGQSGVLSQAVSNPGVIIGMGLTTLALLGMLRKSFIGDKAGAQRYMQYRIMAQFFTITALVAGVTIFGTVYESKEEREKREQEERRAAMHK